MHKNKLTIHLILRLLLKKRAEVAHALPCISQRIIQGSLPKAEGMVVS
jgi:hypothetical protein